MSKAPDIRVGTVVELGKEFCDNHGYNNKKPGDTLTFIQGWFEEDNGLYCTNVECPSIASESEYEDFDSMYHIFGNDFEYFYDCKILNQ